MDETIRALIVGLDAHDSAVAGAVLARTCSNVMSATTTTDALSYYKKQFPQIVIVDTRPQNLSTEDFIRVLCYENREVLIVVTGRYQDEKIINCLKAGASDFIPRPISEDELFLVVSRFCNIIARRSSKKFHAHLFNSAHLEMVLKSSVEAIRHGGAIISNFLTSACIGSELARIELGIQELLRNSLEHGNLGIDYETKTSLCEAGKFDEFVTEQSRIAERENKVIKVKIELAEDLLTCIIHDSGKGFNWRAYRTTAQEIANEGKFSGRGIVLISKIFDSVNYNDSGNGVICTKKLATLNS
ncbi:MAG: ATP-binding protein [Deltaproteobacteria bacterium]|nr:ATP-binding protein [Deltaproteobacteria bacterium]